MIAIIEIEPDYDWDGLFCPRCGEEVIISSSPCQHVTFYYYGNGREFEHLSEDLQEPVSKLRDKMEEMEESDEDDLDDEAASEYVLDRLKRIKDSTTDLIINIIFPDVSGHASISTLIGFSIKDYS